MKKYLAALLIVIMAVSVLSVAGVVGAQIINPGDHKWPPIEPPVGTCPSGGYFFTNPTENSPNPLPASTPDLGSTVQVSVRALPPVILPKTPQVIYVTIFYNKNNFDPLMYDHVTWTFGNANKQASPIAQYVSDVNHDGYKDLTLAFKAKDTGLTRFDRVGTLTGSIPWWVCSCPSNPQWCERGMMSAYILVTGTTPVLVL